jgi:hypothetical protein
MHRHERIRGQQPGVLAEVAARGEHPVVVIAAEADHLARACIFECQDAIDALLRVPMRSP